MGPAQAIWRLLRETFAEWSEDRVPRLGAALAYYTIFSLAPLIVIATLIAGSLFGGQALAQERLVAQIAQLAGAEAALLVNNMVNSVRLPREAGYATIGVGVVGLLLGALGVFVQMQDAFDTIWEVKPNPRANLWRLMRSRLLSFTMLLVIGFLLLVSLVVSAVLTAVSGYLETRIVNYGFFATVTNGLLPLAFTTLLFGIIFKVLPNVKLHWRDVWPGALLTAVLFNVGRYAIGFYLGNTRLGTPENAAGSVLVLLIWVYFSAQILFLGAEFTQVYVKYYGRRKPEIAEDALPVSEQEREKQGMPRKAAPDVEEAQAGRRRRWWPVLRAARAARRQAGRLKVLLGFLAGVGTGAVMAVMALRGGQEKS